jgi:large subunit ribosomal protein L21
MYAIIETGGKQYKVASGQVVEIEKLAVNVGSDVRFDTVLAVVKEDGASYGNPYVKGASVSAEVLAEGKAKKVMVFKQLERKDSRKLRGHRQPFTRIKIKEINFGG